MGLILLITVVAAAVGLARGGSVLRLADVRLRALAPLLGAVAAQLAAVLVDGWLAPALYVASLLLTALVIARNADLPGLGLIGLGLLLNAAVTLTNGAMPVSLHAAVRAGVSSTDLSDLRAGDQPGHEVADRRTRLAGLGDVIPVASPLHREVVSPGDVSVAAGLGLYVLVAMGRRAPARARPAQRPPRRVARWTTRVSESTTRGSYS